MRYSDSLSNIATALSKVQAEIRNPIKNNVNNGVKGAPLYANLEDTLADYVRPVLARHGMSVFQSIKSTENGRVGVCTTLLHESGEFIEGDFVYCEVIIPTSKEGKKILTEGQATGVCITYLRRYSLNAALGINGDKDTDGSYAETTSNYERNQSDASQVNSYEDALSFAITFGKYKGLTLKELYKKDRSYVKWLYSNEQTDANLKKAISIVDAEIERSKPKPENQPVSKPEPYFHSDSDPDYYNLEQGTYLNG